MNCKYFFIIKQLTQKEMPRLVKIKQTELINHPLGYIYKGDWNNMAQRLRPVEFDTPEHYGEITLTHYPITKRWGDDGDYWGYANKYGDEVMVVFI